MYLIVAYIVVFLIAMIVRGSQAAIIITEEEPLHNPIEVTVGDYSVTLMTGGWNYCITITLVLEQTANWALAFLFLWTADAIKFSLVWERLWLRMQGFMVKEESHLNVSNSVMYLNEVATDVTPITS